MLRLAGHAGGVAPGAGAGVVVVEGAVVGADGDDGPPQAERLNTQSAGIQRAGVRCLYPSVPGAAGSR
ncbi:MAG: hypothetical protein A3H97_07635 [Acidobacteria bacterium RIFCSPLOWO2_02_FULL_65_29]|nr:MAG: hypothetical protein A3H97_07635 [Acidobacteria bacterium RIFCSPLOWO2_02_FULL_65_29]